eukprot:s3318_g13.t1
MLLTANIGYCHCAPVCGTGSRAREIPLPANMQHLQANPLRSAEWPLGLPHIQGRDADRVLAANKLYFLTVCMSYIAFVRNFVLSVENPSNAYFWLAMQVLAETYPSLAAAWFANESVHFQACAHGGDRDKWTCWFGTPKIFEPLRAFCTHVHSKQDWRPYLDSAGRPVFPTKAEAACPILFCKRVATLVQQQAISRGAQRPSPAYTAQGKPEEDRASRHGLSSLPPLVAEYKLLTDVQPDDDLSYKLVDTLPNWGKLGYSEDVTGNRGTKMLVSARYKMGEALYGVYRTPEEFVRAAAEARHRIDVSCNIPDLLIRNIAAVLSDGPKLVIARRKLAVLKVKKLCIQLQEDEKKLHMSLDPEMARLLEGKNLLAWKELMRLTGFEDPTLFDEVTKGFKLVGQATASPQFPMGFSSMLQTPGELRKKAIWMRKANMAKCKSTGRPELDRLVWDQTMEEQQAGWLQGPFSEEDVTSMVGSPEWLATRRFPLEQRDKTRLIDDALASGLNSAYGKSNKLTLFDIDTLVAMAIQVAKSLGSSSSQLQLLDGNTIPVEVSGAWKRPYCVLGKTLDLQSAYKQMGPCMDDTWNRIIMVFNPDTGGASFFLSSALMFGSTAAVYAFNRVSRSLWHVLSSLLSLWMTVYYDDFPMLEMQETADSATEGVAAILDLLGWKFARAGKKAAPFSSSFDVLGISIDLSEIANGSIGLRNKPSRVESLSAILDKLVMDARVEPAVASSLHGQLNFAQGQFLGAPLKPAMQFFSKVANHGWSDEMRAELAVATLYAKTLLQNEVPLTVSIHQDTTPILVFTDGAWEPSATQPAGAGIVIVDPVSATRVVHEVEVPGMLLDQLIAELELLPVVVFFETYKLLCRHWRILLFVDNNAVRDAAAKGTSRSLTLLILLSELYRLWSEARCLCWVSRVPTKSNVGDFPSRQQPELAAKAINGMVLPPLAPSSILCNMICDASNFLDHVRNLLGRPRTTPDR